MKRISATTAARHLADVLDDVEHRGEEFVIERHRREVARLAPPGPRRVTWGDVVKELAGWPSPDAQFADDLRGVRAQQGELSADPWESS